MKQLKGLALGMSILLAVSMLGSAFAEENAPATVVAPEQVEMVEEVPAEAVEYVTVVEATPEPTAEATAEPTVDPTQEPTAEPDPSAEPTPEATEAAPEATEAVEATQAPERSVSIHMDVPANLQLGDTVTLTATLIGFDGMTVALQWQYSLDGQQWFDVQGATDTVYAFQVSEETSGSMWRLAVTIL